MLRKNFVSRNMMFAAWFSIYGLLTIIFSVNINVQEGTGMLLALEKDEIIISDCSHSRTWTILTYVSGRLHAESSSRFRMAGTSFICVIYTNLNYFF